LLKIFKCDTKKNQVASVSTAKFTCQLPIAGSFPTAVAFTVTTAASGSKPQQQQQIAVVTVDMLLRGTALFLPLANK